MQHPLSDKGKANKANQRQHNKHKAKFAAWRMIHRSERRHIEKIEAHLGGHPRDLQAVRDLERFKSLLMRR